MVVMNLQILRMRCFGAETSIKFIDYALKKIGNHQSISNSFYKYIIPFIQQNARLENKDRMNTKRLLDLHYKKGVKLIIISCIRLVIIRRTLINKITVWLPVNIVMNRNGLLIFVWVEIFKKEHWNFHWKTMKEKSNI